MITSNKLSVTSPPSLVFSGRDIIALLSTSYKVETYFVVAAGLDQESSILVTVDVSA